MLMETREHVQLKERQPGENDANDIFRRLETNCDGKIIEPIQVIAHSRGAAFGNGYVQGLHEAIEGNRELFADPDNVVDLVLNIAPHQSNSINVKESNAVTIGVSRTWDMLSGDDIIGDAINIQTSGNAHGNGSFINEVDAIIQQFQNNKTNNVSDKYNGYNGLLDNQVDF